MVSINKPNLSQMCTNPTYMYLYLYVFTILKIHSTTNPIKISFLNIWYLVWFLNNIFRVWIKFCLGWSQKHCELTVEHGITVFTRGENARNQRIPTTNIPFRNLSYSHETAHKTKQVILCFSKYQEDSNSWCTEVTKVQCTLYSSTYFVASFLIKILPQVKP